MLTNRKAKAYRLPRKGDEVRLWELGGDGLRRQVEGVVEKRRGNTVYLTLNGRPGNRFTRTREMEIL
jgi:hypothetical protein